MLRLSIFSRSTDGECEDTQLARSMAARVCGNNRIRRLTALPLTGECRTLESSAFGGMKQRHHVRCSG
jgi:hypothetical protein